MNLYELTEKYQEVLNLIEEGEDFGDTLDSIDDAIDDKLHSIAKIMRSVESQADVIKKERQRLMERETTLRNKRESLKRYAEEIM